MGSLRTTLLMAGTTEMPQGTGIRIIATLTVRVMEIRTIETTRPTGTITAATTRRGWNELWFPPELK
jgi:hypothetical protein